MARWLTYARERFPLAVYLLLVMGMTLSSMRLVAEILPWRSSVLAGTGLLLFFAELRLMDELKDYGKDCVAHPDRPLPRGLVGLGEARRVCGWLYGLLLAWCAWTATAANAVAAACLALVCGWLALMYVEFFRGEALARRPLVYALLHQVILIPLLMYPALCIDADAWRSPRVLCLAIAVLGAFFAYEVCRKCDPGAHRVLRTYLSVYGAGKVWLIVAAACATAGAGATGLTLGRILWPAEIAAALAPLVLLARPPAFRWVEGVATLSLLVHLWTIPTLHLVGALK
jgi:hypothetical protein